MLKNGEGVPLLIMTAWTNNKGLSGDIIGTSSNSIEKMGCPVVRIIMDVPEEHDKGHIVLAISMRVADDKRKKNLETTVSVFHTCENERKLMNMGCVYLSYMEGVFWSERYLSAPDPEHEFVFEETNVANYQFLRIIVVHTSPAARTPAAESRKHARVYTCLPELEGEAVSVR